MPASHPRSSRLLLKWRLGPRRRFSMKRANAKRTPRNLTDSVEIRGERKKRQPPQHVRALARLAALAFFLVSSRPPAAAAGAPHYRPGTRRRARAAPAATGPRMTTS